VGHPTPPVLVVLVVVTCPDFGGASPLICDSSCILMITCFVAACNTGVAEVPARIVSPAEAALWSVRWLFKVYSRWRWRRRLTFENIGGTCRGGHS
jgi:hypothetical protein